MFTDIMLNLNYDVNTLATNIIIIIIIIIIIMIIIIIIIMAASMADVCFLV